MKKMFVGNLNSGLRSEAIRSLSSRLEPFAKLMTERDTSLSRGFVQRSHRRELT
jgi:hypothetical protein